MKYIHVRERDCCGNLKATGGYTVAFSVIDRPNGNSKDALIAFSIARCREDEHFCKKIGREEAIKKMIEGEPEYAEVDFEQSDTRSMVNYLLKSKAHRKLAKALKRNG